MERCSLRNRTRVLITAEHAGNRVPTDFAALFRPHRKLLETHRGYDPGTLVMARQLARQVRSPLLAHTVTRLLVEINRSIGHPLLFSEITRHLDQAQRRATIDRFYTPHRDRVIDTVKTWIRQGHRVVHVGVHSFTPVMHGETRNADVGLLYDPSRKLEKALCARWSQGLNERRVRMNYPYRGAADGLTTALRRIFPATNYLGIELELNQGLFLPRKRWPAGLPQQIGDALINAIQ